MNQVLLGVLGVLALLGLFVLMLLLSTFAHWLQGVVAGCPIPLLGLVGMRMRKTDVGLVVQSNIRAKKSGLQISWEQLETHVLAEGRLERVVTALIAAEKAGMKLAWAQATAIDLAGRDILQAVQTSIYPKVINCPDPERGTQEISGVARDGIEIKARACVTVRSNLEQLIGGAPEETIIARVGEGIVSCIGSSESYQAILRNPSQIAKQVMAAGLDNDSAFKILSIDIADIDLGKNIGARLQTSQAAADLRVAQARAEERRALAVATEQEQRAHVLEQRAVAILAQAVVPAAISTAFQGGQFQARWDVPSVDRNRRSFASVR